MQKKLFQWAIVNRQWSIILLFMLVACETVVEIDLPVHTPQLVANAFFHPDGLWDVTLTSSRDPLDRSEVDFVEDALVNILENDQVIATLPYTGEGRYRTTSPRPIAGRTYTLRAAAPGFATVSASDAVPREVAINRVETAIVGSGFDAEMIVDIFFQDPPGERNYYHIMVIGNDNYGGRNPAYFESNDLILENADDFDIEDSRFGGDEALFQDAVFAGSEYRLRISLNNLQFYHSFQIYFSNISEAFYRYQRSALLQDRVDDNPFAEPVLVFDNIENGFGIFAAYNRTIYNISN